MALGVGGGGKSWGTGLGLTMWVRFAYGLPGPTESRDREEGTMCWCWCWGWGEDRDFYFRSPPTPLRHLDESRVGAVPRRAHLACSAGGENVNDPLKKKKAESLRTHPRADTHTTPRKEKKKSFQTCGSPDPRERCTCRIQPYPLQ